jgi:hypothetical protein
MKKLPSALLSAAILLSTCVFSYSSSEQNNARLCMPEEFRLTDPFSKGVPADGNFDTDDNPFDARLMIPAEQVAEAVSGYQPTVKVRTSELRQSLYLVFDLVRNSELPAENLLEIPEHTSLRKVETDSPYYWHFLESAAGEMKSWGSCYDNHGGSYDCTRVLSLGEFQISYMINQENIPVYEKIDKLILNSLTDCQ